MNKIITVSLLTCLITTAYSRQDGFIVLSTLTEERAAMVTFNLNEPTVIDVEALSSTLDSIAELHIKFSLDPDSDDNTKENLIFDILIALEKIGTACRNRNILGVSLDIGEQIFLTRKEVNSIKRNNERMANLNLKNAWTELGATLKRLFPKAKFYAYNWGW